jgi:hypothetical protein
MCKQQLRTEQANTQIELTPSANGHTELANRHPEKHKLASRQTEQTYGHIKRQTEHVNPQAEHAHRQNEQNHEHTSSYIALQAKWQAHANNQLLANEQIYEHTSACVYLPDNLIKIIKNVMNIPCNMPAPPEFSFKLSAPRASLNLTILKK